MLMISMAMNDRKQLSLTSMSLNDFIELLGFSEKDSIALTELVCALLRLLLSDSSTCNKLSSLIPKKYNFAFQPKSLNNNESDAQVDVTIDNLDYDNNCNSLRLLPYRLNIHLINGMRYQPILRTILMRVDPAQRLRKAIAQLEFAQLTYGRSADRRLSRRLSLNHHHNDTSTANSNAMTIVDSGKVQSLRDKDAVLHITNNPLQEFHQLRQAVMELDQHEFYMLSIHHKLAILRVLCDACLETETMRSVLEKNEQDRTAKIAAINKQIRDMKASAKEELANKRDAAIEAVRRANLAAAKAKTMKLSKSGRMTSASVKAKSSKKSLEPTSSQIQAMLEDMMMMEAYGIDEVVPAIDVDIPEGEDENEDDNKRSSSSSRLSGVSKKRQEALNRIKQIDDANELLSSALQSESDRDIKQAIKYAIRMGLRFEDRRGRVIVTELLKQVYKLQYDLEQQAKEAKLQSQLEKALVDYPVRTLPIGIDRHGREYYVFGDDLRLFVHSIVPRTSRVDGLAIEEDAQAMSKVQEKILSSMDGTCRVLYASRPSLRTSEWGYYSSISMLWELYQSLDDRGEKEKALRIALQSKYDLTEPETVYLTEGSEYLGRKVRRQFKNKRVVIGKIVSWLPEHGEDAALWHVLHEDGDEEDLDEDEVKDCLVPEDATATAGETMKIDDTPVVSPPVASKKVKPQEKVSTPSKTINNDDEEAEVEFDENDPMFRPTSSKKKALSHSPDDAGEEEMDEEEADEEDGEEEEDWPYIIKSYSNYAQRHQQAIKSNQIGFHGLQNELLRIQPMVIEGLRNLGQLSSIYSKDTRKQWENHVRDAESVTELSSAILQLEETMHSAQGCEDKKEEDEIMKERELIRKHLEADGWNFDCEISEHIGKHARRFFPGRLTL
jgi:hypothetical protein